MSSKDELVLPPRPQAEHLAGVGLRVWAPAKINLNLLVGERRADGFHDLDSFVAKVTLYDCIDMLPTAGRERAADTPEVSFSCAGADCGPDDRNLALRAGLLMAKERTATGTVGVGTAGDGVRIELTKHIPPGNGLGGGSSDAAAVLWGLNQLWKLGLPTQRLAELAATLGSDVPLFLGPPALRMTGRGEAVTAARVHEFVAILYLPGLHCGTADVYRAYDQLRQGQGASQLQGGQGGVVQPLPAAGAAQTSSSGASQPSQAFSAFGDWQMQASLAWREILATQKPSAWRAHLMNDLGPAARVVCPELAHRWDKLAACLAPVPVPVHLTGSGSALFVLCDDVAEACHLLSCVPQDMEGQCLLIAAHPG